MGDKTYVLVGVGAASLVALAAIVAARRSDAASVDRPRVVTDDGQLEEIVVTASRLPTSDATTVISESLPRGIRNHNPGNLAWLPPERAYNGQSGRDGALGVYKDRAAGLRALALELLNDYRRGGLQTIDALITEYAPPHENPTVAYINYVSRALNVPPNRTLSLNRQTWLKLMRAIIAMENGTQYENYYSDAEIVAATVAAGVPV